MKWPDLSELDPCPHCGCKRPDCTEMFSQYAVTCRICKLGSPMVETREEAAQLWNGLQMKETAAE